MNEQQYVNLLFGRMKNDIGSVGELVKDIERRFPKSVILQYYIGYYYEKVGESDLANEKFKKCTRMEGLFSVPYFHLASYYMNMMEYEESEKYLVEIFGKKMLNMKSGKRNVEFNLEENMKAGVMLAESYKKRKMYKKAEGVYKKMKNYMQTYCKDYKSYYYVETWKNICTMLSEIYRVMDIEKVIEMYKMGLIKRVGYNIGEIEKRRLHEMDKYLLEGLMLMMHYVPKNGGIRMDELNKMVEGVYSEYMIPGGVSMSYVGGKIRIGYISPDFNKNAVGLFLTALLRDYNRDVFEVYCYSTISGMDEFTEIFMSYEGIIWVNVFGMDDVDIYNMMRYEHKLDILVDLISAGSNGKMELMAMSPARVVINYLGYPGTSGLRQVEYKLVDWKTDPEGHEMYYTEKLIRMPRCFICYTLFEGINVDISYRDHMGINVGIMNKKLKQSKEIRAIWREILELCEDITLCVKGDECDDINEYYVDFPEGRVRYIPFANSLEGYLDIYNELDVCVDTYPYSGTTTTCSGLYMGVPVFTIYDKCNQHVSNVTGSILLNMGLEEYVCGSFEEYKRGILDYCEKMVKSNEDEKRMKMRGRFMELMDTRRFMEEYESLMESLI